MDDFAIQYREVPVAKLEAPQINWSIVWRRFSRWFHDWPYKHPGGSFYPSWRSQQLKIKELVEEQLRRNDV